MKGHNSFSSFYLLLTLLIFISFGGPADLRTCLALKTHPTAKTSTQFIRSRCNATEFPQLCIKSLSSYATTIRNSPVQLADAALSVSLDSARSTSAMMTRMSADGGRMSSREAEAVSDCVESLGDSVDYLRHSLKEMGQLRGKDVRARTDDVQTWVSTALTDESTCMDEFEADGTNGSVRSAVRGHVVKVAQLTSNALALVSALASTESIAP